MSACPTALALPSLSRRRPIVVSQRRLEANRHNAERSTGPRTEAGKARVGRNAIKHGFFVGLARWTPQQHRDFVSTLDGLRDDLRPHGIGEESCVWTIAYSYVRMASMLRYRASPRTSTISVATASWTRASRGRMRPRPRIFGIGANSCAAPDCGSRRFRVRARPTRSRATWAASIGRFGRPHRIFTS